MTDPFEFFLRTRDFYLRVVPEAFVKTCVELYIEVSFHYKYSCDCKKNFVFHI